MVTGAVEMTLENQWHLHPDGLQAHLLVMLVMIRQQIIVVVLQLFPEAAATAMGRSTTLASAATGGLRAEAQVPMRGIGT